MLHKHPPTPIRPPALCAVLLLGHARTHICHYALRDIGMGSACPSVSCALAARQRSGDKEVRAERGPRSSATTSRSCATPRRLWSHCYAFRFPDGAIDSGSSLHRRAGKPDATREWERIRAPPMSARYGSQLRLWLARTSGQLLAPARAFAMPSLSHPPRLLPIAAHGVSALHVHRFRQELRQRRMYGDGHDVDTRRGCACAR